MNMKAPKLDKTPKTLVQVSARAFISPRDERGGNPVTIFHLSAPTLADERSKLARSCSWESIIIDDNYSSEDAHREIMPIFHFYMPSGEEVSFCGREFKLCGVYFPDIAKYFLPSAICICDLVNTFSLLPITVLFSQMLPSERVPSWQTNTIHQESRRQQMYHFSLLETGRDMTH